MCVCVAALLLISVYLTFVPMGSQWAAIYPAAANVAGRKDEAGDGEDVAVGHMDDGARVCVCIACELDNETCSQKQVTGLHRFLIDSLMNKNRVINQCPML